MERKPLTSSNIREAGFDAQALTLELLFADGGVYHYFGVPESVYIALLKAPSAGQYFHKCIKSIYAFKRL